jgi:hypothetical protein
MVEAGFTKAIKINLKRHKRGVRVHVKVTPDVEEFFRHWGGDNTEGPSYGRLWKSLVDGEKLTLWSFDAPMRSDGATYSLAHTGHSFYTDQGHINLSMLRLVGASDGRSFIVESVMSRPELERIAARINKASEQFYMDYIQPVNLEIYVGVRDRAREDSI